MLSYRHIFEKIENPIAVVNKDYEFREVNPAYCNLFKKLRGDIVGKCVSSIIGEDAFRSIAQAKYDRCFSGEKVRFQTWYKVPEAGRRFFDIQYFPHYNANQEIDAAISCIRDITDISELQNSLTESEDRFKAFMDNIPANIYIKDENDVHVYFNKHIEETMGQTAEKLLGKKTHDFFEAAVADHLVNLDQKILAENVPATSEEWVLEADSKSRYLRDYKFPIALQSGGKLLGGIAFDVTEIKKNEHDLQQALNEIKSLKSELERENISLREELKSASRTTAIIGDSKAFNKCFREAQQVAPELTTVLVLGETGTGKELMAQAIHDMSPRRGRPMIKVNCAALPANLIESELFGRKKGAYTGAMVTQLGRFESAHKSTIFLDEIGDLPLELQSKLLRVLQEGTFEMLGSNKEIQVDTRIIAATNQDLKELAQKGLFRKDLYYRINVFPITVPPLRTRRNDIPLLVWKFIDEFNKTMGKSVTKVDEADMEALKHAEWPGNVRELKNIVERSMILSTGNALNVQMTFDVRHLNERDGKMAGSKLSEVEKDHILKTLEQTGWRVSGKKGAAEILGLKPTTLEARMKKLGISRPSRT